MKHVYWSEPWYGTEELPVHVELSCSVEHAINLAKNVAAKRGHTYLNDEEALNDFLAVHWAEIRE